MLDVAVELRAAVANRQLEATGVVRFALQPDLFIRTSASRLRSLLNDVVAQALAAAPNGDVLVTGARSASSIVIAIGDNGSAGRDRRTGDLRRATETCALLGGSLDIETVTDGGATILLRLPTPMPGAAPSETGSAPALRPAHLVS